MTTTSDTDGLRRFFGVAVDPQTYCNLAYLLLAFPLGIAYFTILSTGVSAGVGTIPVLVGVPILIAVLAVAVFLAEFESRLTSRLLGVDVERESPAPRDEDVVDYVKGLVMDPRTYLDAFYLASKFAIGLASFVALTVAGSMSLAFVAAPFVYGYEDVEYRIGPEVVVDTFPEALGLFVVGVLLAFGSLHAINLLARVVGEYTRVLLGSGES